MDKLSNSKDVRRFLQGLGVHIDEATIHQMVDVLSGKTQQSLYSFYSSRTGKPSICGKGSVYKIKKLYDECELQPYLDYLYGSTTIDKDKIEQTHKSEDTNETIAVPLTQEQQREVLRQNNDQPANDVKFSVEPKLYLTTAMLEVSNQSQIETFHGTIRIVGLETHRLHWDGYGTEAKLGNGDVANVQIAQWEWMSQQMIAVHLIESASGNPSSFMPRLYNVQNGVIENPEPIYLEVIIKPLSSSKIEHRAFYSIEPSIKKPMIFHKIDSIPSTSHREAEMHDKENLKRAIVRSKVAGEDLIKNKSTEVRPDFYINWIGGTRDGYFFRKGSAQRLYKPEEQANATALILDSELFINTSRPILVESLQLYIAGTLYSSDWKSETLYTDSKRPVCFDFPLIFYVVKER